VSLPVPSFLPSFPSSFFPSVLPLFGCFHSFARSFFTSFLLSCPSKVECMIDMFTEVEKPRFKAGNGMQRWDSGSIGGGAAIGHGEGELTIPSRYFWSHL
jgi:hypothetical protein